ncbi:MAG: hypothetical protein AB7U75_20010 [Hyphomicrobiaceae bacterium]
MSLEGQGFSGASGGDMARNVIIHIGTHKTGTTSLQALLHKNRRAMKRQGFEYYDGTLSEKNHYDLNLAVVRGGVETFANYNRGTADQLEIYNNVREKITAQMRRSSAHTFVFSNEGLSYLRTKQECERLKSLFTEQNIKFKILLVLRNKEDFLRSYKNQLLKDPRRTPSSNKKSGLYVESDTWLLDFDELQSAYESVFSDVVTIDYVEQGLLSKLLAEIGLQLDLDEQKYQLNSSTGAARSGGWTHSLGERLKRIAWKPK